MSVKRCLLTMEAGAPIGEITAGLLHVVKQKLTATPGEGARRFVLIGREELRKAHYTMPGDENPLFGDEDDPRALFQLGAEITNLHLDVYYKPGWIGVTAQNTGAMTVNWQVYDTTAKKVVFSRVTTITFYNEVKEVGSEAPIYGMFRSSIHELLAAPEFAAFMRPEPPPLPPPAPPHT